MTLPGNSLQMRSRGRMRPIGDINEQRSFRARVSDPLLSIVAKQRYPEQTVVDFAIDVIEGTLATKAVDVLDEMGRRYPVTVLYSSHISTPHGIRYIIGLSGISLEQAQTIRMLVERQ